MGDYFDNFGGLKSLPDNDHLNAILLSLDDAFTTYSAGFFRLLNFIIIIYR